MKIYSWNILYRNRELDRAFAFISKSDFDIFCLQEVPEEFLPRLQTLPYAIAYRLDTERIFPTSVERLYVVTLSKYQITGQGELPFPEYRDLLPLRTRVFIALMPNKFFSHIRDRGGLYIDCVVDGKTVRIFNLHLILANPRWRMKEFERAMLEHDPSRRTIVCGDFNILEKPHITPLNWLLGGKLSDTLLYSRERTHIEKRFVEHQLVNPLYGGVTHPLSQSQLDHILVSNSFFIQKAEIIPDRMGSDHHPIRVEIV